MRRVKSLVQVPTVTILSKTTKMSLRKIKTQPEINISGLIPELRKRVNMVDDFNKGGAWLKKQPDSTLARFLKGHNGNLDQTMDALMDAAKWRWSAGMDQMMDTYEKDLSPTAVLIKGHWPSGITGRDHRGKPVSYNHLTAIDFPGLVGCVGMDPLVKYMAFQIETLLQEEPNGGGFLIMDLGLDGLSATFAEVRMWIQHMVLFVKKLATVMDCYPETFAQIIFCRAPKLFWPTWKVTKNFLPERTLRKIKVLSYGVDVMPTLLEHIDADSIPPELGGTSRVVLGVGGKVPKGALEDDEFINNLRAHVRLMQGDFSNGRQSMRFSSLRTKAEEDDMQEQLALELLKTQIEEAKKGGMQTSHRGSWKYEPGLDVLDNVDDAMLLSELRNENFDPAKTLLKLKAEAAKKEGIKLPKDEPEAISDSLASDESDDKNGKGKKCSIM